MVVLWLVSDAEFSYSHPSSYSEYTGPSYTYSAISASVPPHMYGQNGTISSHYSYADTSRSKFDHSPGVNLSDTSNSESSCSSLSNNNHFSTISNNLEPEIGDPFATPIKSESEIDYQRFSTPSNFKFNITNECNVCKKTFSQSHSLTRHMRIHTGERPYRCDVCGKCFGTNDYLKIHMRIHTGEKPYKCAVCDKTFIRADTLQKHKQKHGKKNSSE